MFYNLFFNHYTLRYTDSIKYFSFTFTTNNSDDVDILKHMIMLYCKSNRLIGLFNTPCLSYMIVCAQYGIVFILLKLSKNSFSKIRVSYTSRNQTHNRKSWEYLDVRVLVVCLSLTTFLILKLYSRNICIYLI